MLIEFDLVLTKVGQQALWNSQNTGVELDLTHIQIGTSSANYGKEYDSIGLDTAVDTIAIAKGQRITDEQIRIITTIQGNGNHLVTELGVWSGNPDTEGSILFAYVVSKQEDQLAITSKGLSIVFSLDLVFSGEDIENIKIIADQDQSLVLSMLTDHFTDQNAHPYYAHKLQDNTFTGVNLFTQEIEADISGTAQHAVKADHAMEADSADFALSAFKAKEAEEALIAEHATTADSAETAYSAFQATEAETAQVAIKANQLTNARTIGLYGAVAGNPTAFNGTANILIEVTTVNGEKVRGTVEQANTANRLKEAVNIHGVSFDGSESIDLPVFTSEKSGLVPNSEYEDGEANRYLCEDGTWKVLENDSSGGEADHATTADKLKTARTISLSGAITGTPTEFDGSSNISIPVTYIDGSKVTGFVPNATNANNALTASSASSATSATTAVRLTNSRFISISGAVKSNSVAFNGSADVVLEVQSVTATTAEKLATARKIQNVEFDGSKNITLPTFTRGLDGLVPKSGTEISSITRYLCEDGTWKMVDTSNIPEVKHSLTTDKLKTARKIQNVEFDGSKDIALPVFNRVVNGLVPSSGTNIPSLVRFLCEDGTWKAVSGGGGNTGNEWRDVTALRVKNVIYFNETDQQIDVALSGVSTFLHFRVSKDQVNWVTIFGGGGQSNIYVTIDPQTYYKLELTDNSDPSVPKRWAESRKWG